jgi:hypothetical protein
MKTVSKIALLSFNLKKKRLAKKNIIQGLILVSILTIFNLLNSYAQEKNIDNENSLSVLNSMNYNYSKKLLEVHYGVNNTSYKIDNIQGFGNEFTPQNTFKIKLGTVNVESFEDPKCNSILGYSSKFISISNYNANSKENATADSAISLNSWRFSLGSDGGFGYKFGNDSYIVLYSGDAINWNWLDLEDVFKQNNILATSAMNNFGEQVRFGTSFESGVKVKVLGNVHLSASYERNLIFPRYLNFYSNLSSLTELIATSIPQFLVNNLVLESAPEYLPVVNFVLKNAISYGFYELRSKNMNWPFNTTAPLMMDGYRIGVSFEY